MLLINYKYQAKLFIFQIVPALYIGNYRDAKDTDQLEANKITHILSIHDNAKKLLDVSPNY